MTQAQLKSFSGSNSIPLKQDVDAVTCSSPQNNFWNQRELASNFPKSKECYFCSGTYSPKYVCPAKGKMCSQCRKPNNFTKVCRSKNVSAIDEENEQTGATSEKDEKVFLCLINQDNVKDEAIVTLIINNQLPVGFKLDTGVQANIIPKSVFDQLSPKPKLQSTNQRLTSYCGAKIPVLGICHLKCSHKTGSPAMHKFYIDSWSAPITSYQSSISLDLIKLILNVNSGEPQACIQDQCK